MKNNYILKEIDGLDKLRNSKALFSEIILFPSKIYFYGLLTYALKYSSWKLAPDGKLIVLLEGSSVQSFNKKNLSDWQVINTIMNTLSTSMDVTISKNSVTCIKRSSDSISCGVSIGILFSGSGSELQMLNDSVNSLLFKNQKDSIEVIVVGPQKFEVSLIDQCSDLRFKYLVYDDISSDDGRFLISKKKNFLYSHLKYQYRVISHSRIIYPENFVEELLQSKFDLATPMVNDESGSRYLDLIFIGSYDVSKPNPRRTLTTDLLGKKYFNLIRDRVPYIDGGIIIFDSLKFGDAPFNEKLAWGEAEDLDLCKHAASNWLIVDMLDSIVCISKINKLKRSVLRYNRYSIFIKKILIKLRIY
jgi:hypothetical protein